MGYLNVLEYPAGLAEWAEVTGAVERGSSRPMGIGSQPPA
jgi:hypothetical protein